MAAYSSRLGTIQDQQFAAAVRKARIGEFISASPVSGGLFGQNVFLATTKGDYVFRGAPHWHKGGPNDAWQFPKERFYADLLHTHTDVPVAWPQHLDDSCADFPWPYLIMPRLPGLCLANPADREGLNRRDFVEIAQAMGQTLAALQTLTSEFAGDFDPAVQRLVPYPGGYAVHLRSEIEKAADEARRNHALGTADDEWLADLFEADHSPQASPATFVHNDYHLGNVLLQRTQSSWEVSGVVDLMTCCFGDPAADLVRQSCDWLDRAPHCVDAYLSAYRQAGGCAAPTTARLALLVVYERLLIWSYFTRPDVAHPPFQETTFRAWAEPYSQTLAEMWFGGARTVR